MPLVVNVVTPPSATQTGTLASGSAVVTGLSDTSLLAGALGCSGTGVPRKTYVLSIDSATQLTLTQPATASGAVALTFALEPIELAEAKGHLRVTIDDDDAQIARLIVAARRYCEVLAKRTFLSTTFDVIDDAFPFTGGYYNLQVRQFYGQFNGGQGAIYPGVLALNSGIVTFPRSPLQSVVSISYVDPSGNLLTLSPSIYKVAAGSPGRVAPLNGQIWPVTRPDINAVTYRIVAGSGPTAASIVETDMQAVLLMLGHLYENREAVMQGSPVEAPLGVAHLLGASDNCGGYA